MTWFSGGVDDLASPKNSFSMNGNEWDAALNLPAPFSHLTSEALMRCSHRKLKRSGMFVKAAFSSYWDLTCHHLRGNYAFRGNSIDGLFTRLYDPSVRRTSSPFHTNAYFSFICFNSNLYLPIVNFLYSTLVLVV